MIRIILISITIFFTSLPLFAQTHTAWVEIYSCGLYTYTSAHDNTVDKSNNVYVVGECASDYITIKYYPNGDTAWVRIYKSPGFGEDIAVAIVVDDSGNVFVTGITGFFQPGNGPYMDITTIKYYPNGDTAWVRDYSRSPNFEEFSRDIAVDGSGNCYVVGYSHGGMSLYDYVTIKYRPNGDTAWLRRYNGPGNGHDTPYAITLDSTGNVYVTGKSAASEEGTECTTIKYDSTGNEIWVKRYNGTANGGDGAFDIAVDKNGNVYVTGQIHNSTSGYDCGTIKYDPNGNELWVRTYNGVETYSEDRSNALVIDDSSNVYVTGISGSYQNYDYLTIMYDPTGNEKWVRTYNGLGNGWDESFDISLDNSGNLYVTGVSDKYADDPWSFDFATVMYDPNGNELCVKRYGGTGLDVANAVSVDDSSNVYVTGMSYGVGITTIKYFPIGMAGDTNGGGNVTLSDVVYLICYLFKGGPSPNPIGSADVNDDETVNLNDVVYLLNYLFKGGPPPIC